MINFANDNINNNLKRVLDMANTHLLQLNSRKSYCIIFSKATSLNSVNGNIKINNKSLKYF